MIYSEIRTEFISQRWSGRSDLSTAQVDLFLEAGIRYLESNSSHPRLNFFTTPTPSSLIAGTYQLALTNPQKISAVQIYVDGEWVPLFNKTWDWIVNNYPKLEDEDRGEPLYWAISPIDRTTYPTQSCVITLMPPSDRDYDLLIQAEGGEGKPADAQTNFWCSQYPTAVLMAGMRELYLSYKNQPMYNFFSTALMQEMMGAEKDNTKIQLSQATGQIKG